MSGRAWRVLVDENVQPRVAEFLRSEGHEAQHVQSVLSKGAGDFDDVLPYAVEHNMVVLTADTKDFASLSVSDHEGLLLLYNQRAPAYDVANAVLDIIEEYEQPERLTVEIVDDQL